MTISTSSITIKTKLERLSIKKLIFQSLSKTITVKTMAVKLERLRMKINTKAKNTMKVKN